MSGYRVVSRTDGSSRPIVINRDPQIINRSPEHTTTDLITTETKRHRSRSLNQFNFLKPFSRRYHTVVVQRKRGPGGEEPSSSRPQTSRGRSSPPPPPTPKQRTARSLSPLRRTKKMSSPHKGKGEYVPLPPKLLETQPEPEGSRKNSPGSRNSRPKEEADRDLRSLDFGTRRSRPYGNPPILSDPMGDQEQVLETTPPKSEGQGNYVYTKPNETIRSRVQDNNVKNTREYRELKAREEQSREAAERATDRISILQRKVADMEQREIRSNEIQDRLHAQNENYCIQIKQLKSELERAQRDLRDATREAGRAEELRNLQRQDQERERDREREREQRQRDRAARDNSGSSGGEAGRRQHRRRVYAVHQERTDAEPRTPAANTRPTSTGDAGLDAIAQARADAAARSGRARN